MLFQISDRITDGPVAFFMTVAGLTDFWLFRIVQDMGPVMDGPASTLSSGTVSLKQ
jgi:hypothetical protein